MNVWVFVAYKFYSESYISHNLYTFDTNASKILPSIGHVDMI